MRTAVPPFYADGSVTVYHGDCLAILPQLAELPDACVTDPPFGETSAAWDTWPQGWVTAVGAALPPAASLWSFGSARMFMTHLPDFASWKFAQELLWAKRNGTGPTSRDRLVKVHEWAYHWYRGRWSDLHHEWEREESTEPSKGYVRKPAPAADHQRTRRASAWQDDGTRQPRSVTYVIESPSVRYAKRHQDEKPLACVLPIVRECTPPPRPRAGSVRGIRDHRHRGPAPRPPSSAHRGRRAVVRADRHPAAGRTPRGGRHMTPHLAPPLILPATATGRASS